VLKAELENKVVEALVKLVKAAATVLPPDVEQAMRAVLEKEENPLALGMLRAMVDNLAIAKRESLPICQDTGTVIFYVKAGERFPLLGRLPSLITSATKIATEQIPLRPNVVNPFTGKNTGDNTGRFIPWIEWEVEPDSDSAEITVVLKGGGSEAPSIAKTLSPAEGVKGLMKLVVDTIVDAGAKPCPPVIVGVGVGPTADIALKLAKKALLRHVGQRHEDAEVANLEQALLEAVNNTGLGPHGVGGKTTALDVHVEYAYRHPAAFSVGVAVMCWAARMSKMKVDAAGNVTFLTHRELGVI